MKNLKTEIKTSQELIKKEKYIAPTMKKFPPISSSTGYTYYYYTYYYVS